MLWTIADTKAGQKGLKSLRNKYYASNCLKVYVQDEKTNEEETRALLSNFEQICEIEVVKSTFTEQTMGFAFVYFVEPGKAREA